MATTTSKKWLDELTLELRLRDVSGDRIGDTLATVKEFLADSGEEPEDAFGTPEEYAASLDLPRDPAAASITGVVTRAAVGLMALLAFTQAAWAWAGRETLDVGAVQLAWLAVPVLAVALLPLYLHILVRKVWFFIGVTAVCVTAGVFAAISAPQESGVPWLHLDPLPILIVAGVVMVAPSIIGTVETVRDSDHDLISDPLADPPITRRQRDLSRLVGIAGAWLFPVFSLVSLCIALLGT